jgi:hypothetical protein
MGPRYITAQLHNNRQGYQDGIVPKGTPVYWFGSFGTPPSTNSNLQSGGLNQTVVVPDVATSPDDLNKTITPYPVSWPIHEPPYQAPLFISVMEFTIGDNIECFLEASTFLSCWDGNTAQPTPPKVRAYYNEVD